MDERSKERVGIKSAISFIERINAHYPRMELGQLRVLLRILERPGVRASELRKSTGLSKSALSRAIRLLADGTFVSDGDGREVDGLGLVSQIVDPADARARLIVLTRNGRDLATDIEAHLQVGS